MRALSTQFFINGQPMLVPDEDVSHSFEDLDDAAAGRDESGYMHRILVRSKVGVWVFSYAFLTDEELRYMEQLFGDGATFLFTHPARLDSAVSEHTTCYRSKYSLSWKNARTGLWTGYGFHIIQC